MNNLRDFYNNRLKDSLYKWIDFSEISEKEKCKIKRSVSYKLYCLWKAMKNVFKCIFTNK